MKWPKEFWPLLFIQSAFLGEAKEVYSALSLAQSTDYHVIKKNFCKKKGHVKYECWALQRKNQRSNDDRPSPNALTAVQGKFTYSQFENTNVKPESDVLREEFRPFVFNGLVSVDNEVHPIRILRDTGASQSLLLEDLLSLSEKTHTGSGCRARSCESSSSCY